MKYCFNPRCPYPQNQDSKDVCSNCGSNLQLKDRYCAIEAIGQGGFGKTYLAINKLEEPSSLCVIKQFTFLSSSPTALHLFSKEAQQLKTLGSHEQIPTFIDYLEQENLYYIVQEYINGSNLEEELAVNGAFSETQIQELLLNVLPVIEFVHSHNVIHRDIKPENIIRRDSDGSLYLVDFGAAKSITQIALAKIGTTIGSAGYAAPEQVFGKATTQSDLYSLGVTCVHLLTGIHPFDLVDSASGDWVWRDYLNQSVNRRLGQVLDKLLERGTRQRYHSTKEVLQDLQGLQVDIAAKDEKLISITDQLQEIEDRCSFIAENGNEYLFIPNHGALELLEKKVFVANRLLFYQDSFADETFTLIKAISRDRNELTLPLGRLTFEAHQQFTSDYPSCSWQTVELSILSLPKKKHIEESDRLVKVLNKNTPPTLPQ